ncbi:PREDICTED: thioredoxin-2-like [Acropora digitifera]|uniref:thioredoxin-2-like n=1 Tax=Acropora digitifera TaxID=70779 RepID=UPI00077A561A|nr:PREDICTED: thioredoxin-2-like [Acropora digitifera]
MAKPVAGQIVELETKEDFDNFLKEAGEKLVVVDFFATWCGPCKKMSPTIKKLAEEYADKVFFAKVDVDENADTAEEQEISAMPTFMLYKSRRKVDSFTGANAEKLKELVQRHC